MGTTSGLIGGIIATILLSVLASRANPKAKETDGRKVITYGVPIKILGWVMMALGGFFVFAASKASQDQTVIAWSVAGTIFFGCLSLWVEFYLVSIEFTSTDIHTRSPWRKKRQIKWEDITEYSYSEINRWYKLKTKSNGIIRLSILLSGLDDFFEELERQNKNVANQGMGLTR